MKRVVFKLCLPGSGGSGNFFNAINLSDRTTKKILGDSNHGSWCYTFGDGTRLFVTADIAPYGKRLQKSNGFCGYDWAIDSIIRCGEIKVKII